MPLEYQWACPGCETKNIDDYVDTAVPMCSECQKEFMWEDIMPGDIQTQYNKKINAG